MVNSAVFWYDLQIPPTLLDIKTLLAGYDLSKLAVACMGGHSALDVAHGCHGEGFGTIVLAPKGLERIYAEHYRTRRGRGCVEKTIVLTEPRALYTPETVAQLRADHAVFVHDRGSAEAAEDLTAVLKTFDLPMFGSRALLSLERSSWSFSQDHLLSWSGIRTPRTFASADEMDGTLCIVKARSVTSAKEPAFFLATDKVSWLKEGNRLEVEGKIAKGWEEATIEEFVLGMPVNFNFFFSPLTEELELLGTDERRMTNLEGFLRMTADQQLKVLEHVDVRMRETGQMICTIKESLLEQAYQIGWNFVRTAQQLKPEVDPEHRGVIGPFSLQGAVTVEDGRQVIVIYDVSFRVPGSPGISATPYGGYLHGQSMSVGERIGKELREAISANCLEKVLT